MPLPLVIAAELSHGNTRCACPQRWLQQPMSGLPAFSSSQDLDPIARSILHVRLFGAGLRSSFLASHATYLARPFARLSVPFFLPSRIEIINRDTKDRRSIPVRSPWTVVSLDLARKGTILRLSRSWPRIRSNRVHCATPSKEVRRYSSENSRFARDFTASRCMYARFFV